MNPPTHPPRSRSLVVVLGMHRSGTSLLANFLDGLKVHLGNELLPADENNPEGYWEHAGIVRLHAEILELLDRQWIGSKGSLPYPAQWWRAPALAPRRARLAEIVAREVSSAGGLWGFKDPRTSRLLPMWKEIFRSLDLEPIYLLAIREPNAVTASVVARDRIPAARAQLQWLAHKLDALRDAGGQVRLVVDYDRWFTHPAQQARAVIAALNLPPPDNEAELLAVLQTRINGNLRHHASEEKPSLPFVAQTYELLREAAVTGKVPDALWEIEARVRQARELCASWGENPDALSPCWGGHFSFIEHFAQARLLRGQPGQVAIWEATLDGRGGMGIYLQPPAKLVFDIPVAARGQLSTAIAIHPDAWNKPGAGGCEFRLGIDGRIACVATLDPVNLPTDRHWQEIQLDVPENPLGGHRVVFETAATGNSADFRWAVWRAPQFRWRNAGFTGTTTADAPSAAAEAEPGSAQFRLTKATDAFAEQR